MVSSCDTLYTLQYIVFPGSAAISAAGFLRQPVSVTGPPGHSGQQGISTERSVERKTYAEPEAPIDDCYARGWPVIVGSLRTCRMFAGRSATDHLSCRQPDRRLLGGRDFI